MSEVRCPICQAPIATRGPAFPFCSPRCQSIDLGNWLDGRYAIPMRPEEQEDEASDGRTFEQ